MGVGTSAHTGGDPRINALLGELQKKYGENKVMRASDVVLGPPISTGSLALDFATGYGGIPSNRVAEIYGRPGTGKTTLALLTMLNALEKNPQRGALFLDLEHKITPEWMEMIVGRDIIDNRLIYISPTSIENATNIYRQAVESGTVCCTILDSIGGAASVRDGDDAEKATYGGNAMGVGKFARSAAALSDAYDCLTIGVNQIRANMNPRGFTDDTPGGHQWKHTCVLRVELVRGNDTETIKMPGEEKPFPIGYTVYGKIRKNQVGAPGRTAWWWFYNYFTEAHGFGVDQLDEVSRLSIATKVVKMSGGWYSHPALPPDKKGEHKVLGLAKLQGLLKEDEALRKTIVSEVLASLGEHAGEVAPMSDPEGPVELTGMAKLMLEGEAV